MKNSAKYKKLKFLIVLAFVIAACVIAAAENDEDSNEVFTTAAAPDTNSVVSEDSNESSMTVDEADVNSVADANDSNEFSTTFTMPDLLETIKEVSSEAATTGAPLGENKTVSKDSNEVITLEQRLQKTISVDFVNTPIEDVLKMIAEQANVDIIKSPTVTGNVTAKLTNVPLREVLNNILAINGYGCVIDKNMIRVSLLNEIAQKEEILETKVYHITYADIGDVESALKKIITKRGSISSSRGTSDIIVKDVESNIKAIENFIEKIDRVTPQVLVEVRIYDVSSTDGFNIGADWTTAVNNNIKSIDGVTPATDLTDVTDGDDHYTYRRTRPFVGGDFTATTGGTIQIGFLDTVSAEITLNILRSEVGAKLLANPRILVLDNESANFEIITQIPYAEQSTTGSTITNTYKFKDVGIELKVTPHVTRDGMIRLNISPEFGVRVGTTTPPIVDTRKVDTKALVKDGQTVVLGGLRKREVSQEVHKIAFLGDIPLLGSLFSDVEEQVVTSELIIFITPRIVTEPTLSSGESKNLGATNFNDPRMSYTLDERTEQKAAKKAGK